MTRRHHPPPSNPIAAAWAFALLVCLAPPSVVASEPAADSVAEPRALLRQLDNRRPATRRWRRLFTIDQGGWIARDLALIRIELGPRAQELFASRLLYDGEPWDNERPAARRGAWRLRQEAVAIAILREWRYQQATPGIVPVLERFLQQARQANLVETVLLDLLRRDRARGFGWLARAVGPDHPAALPATASALVRSRCLRLAAAYADERPAILVRGLRYGLLRADGLELRQAAAVAQRHPAVAAPLLPRALRRLLLRAEGRSWDGDHEAALVDLLACDAAWPPELQPHITEALLQGDRQVAAAVAGACIRQRLVLSPPVLAEVRQRAANAADVALRHALLGVLALGDPDQVRDEAGPGNPWTILSLHRARIEEAFGEVTESEARSDDAERVSPTGPGRPVP